MLPGRESFTRESFTGRVAAGAAEVCVMQVAPDMGLQSSRRSGLSSVRRYISAAAAGPPEPPEDYIEMPVNGEAAHAGGQHAVYNAVEAGTFDDLPALIQTQDIENMLDPNGSQN